MQQSAKDRAGQTRSNRFGRFMSLPQWPPNRYYEKTGSATSKNNAKNGELQQFY